MDSRRRQRLTHRTHRAAFTVTELLVAATLLMTVLSVVTQLTVRTSRLRQETQREMLALDELANQLDRLTTAEPAERESMLNALTLSEALTEELPDAQLTAKTIRDLHGVRLQLQLQWNRPGEARPLTLDGWLDATPDDEPTDATEATP